MLHLGKDLVHGGSLGRVDGEHPLDQIDECGRVEAVGRELRAADDAQVRALDDVLLVAREGALEGRVVVPNIEDFLK